jgi:hypothetical protein
MTINQQMQIIERICPIIQVTDSNGKIETSQVIKENNRYRNITTCLEYNLKKPNHKLLESIIRDIENSNNQKSKLKWTSLNFIQKIFYNKKKRLLKEISNLEDFSWLIIPDKLASLIIKYIDNQLFIIENPDKDSNFLLFGKYDSFELVLNSNEEYQIIQKNKIKILELI